MEQTWAERSVRIEFDGIYRNSEVWINGIQLGRRPNGYIGFESAKIVLNVFYFGKLDEYRRTYVLLQ